MPGSRCHGRCERLRDEGADGFHAVRARRDGVGALTGAVLTSRVRQLKAVVGTGLLRTLPDGRLALTAYGKRFACDVTPILKMPAPP
jgi:hypothetical protein